MASLTGQKEHTRETSFRRLFLATARNLILWIYHLLTEKTRLHRSSRHAFVRNIGEIAAPLSLLATASFRLAEPFQVYLAVMR